jgi:hypothetical protein
VSTPVEVEIDTASPVWRWKHLVDGQAAPWWFRAWMPWRVFGIGFVVHTWFRACVAPFFGLRVNCWWELEFGSRFEGHEVSGVIRGMYWDTLLVESADGTHHLVHLSPYLPRA